MRMFRRAVHHWLGAALGFGMLLGAAGVGAGSPAHAAGTVPNFDHIFTIMMENHSYSDIIGNSQAPYINSLASRYGLATNYFAVSHPSLPNYLAATGASTFGVTSDCTTCFQAQPNIAVDRVEASGRSWKAYMESMPSPCFVGDSGEYAQKHDPFVYYNDIRLNSTECNKVVPYPQLATDLASTTTTPNYAWITPNLIDDMHDGTIAQGDTWLSQNVPTILNSPAFTQQNSLLMITWDEDDSSMGNQVPMLMIASSVGAGTRSAAQYNHYSYLKTIEGAWGLSPLTSNDGGASAMSDFFGGGTTTPPSFTADTPPTSATVGQPYSYTFQASGTPAPTYALASGSLPSGLSLNGTTGVLSGTPILPGSSTFTVSATNSAGSATTPSITITVTAGATVPGAPTGVSAVADKHASATVSWTAPSSTGGCSITGYTVTSSPGGKTASVGGSTLSAKVTRLTVGTSYTFTTTATNCAGTGPASAPSNAIVARR
ncbi:MAG TPA: alkaline phosphatase family protein [Actinomycetota bacterium]|nr:alkaline phosphatase family protein [Actinomycetota bacterium]